ncbi:MAG: VTT domain-containing protein [Clostridia bacterium]|nr:VTT domain-containing protein [Clostridia bacterium]
MDKKKTKKTILNVIKIAVVAALFAVIAFNYEFLSQLDVRILIESASSVTAAALMVLAVYGVKSVVFVIPASLIYLSVGMAFETPLALLINALGIMIEITLSYLLGRFLGGEKVEAMLKGKKGYGLLEKLKSKGKYAFVFLLRFLSFPIDFGSLFFGASGFSFVSYFFMSLLGILPRVLLMTVLGYGIYELIPTKYILIAVLCAVPTAVIGVIAAKAVKRKNSKSKN